MDEQKSKASLLNALMTKPSKYHISVVDSSNLPKGMRKKKEITFEVKPPVLKIMVKTAEILNNLPKEALDPLTPPSSSAKYAKELCMIFAIMCHGTSSKEIPEWYVPFLMSNLTPKEMVYLIQEISTKTRTDFFLPSFQIASAMNPMTMMKKKELEKMTDSTHMQ